MNLVDEREANPTRSHKHLLYGSRVNSSLWLSGQWPDQLECGSDHALMANSKPSTERSLAQIDLESV